jgi:hypothetical protein
MDIKTGSHFTKLGCAECVINIVPPRDVWQVAQKIRTKYISEARCVIHNSSVEPFVKFQHYEEAAKLLKDGLSDIKPFDVTLEKVEYFKHSNKSFTLYLAPNKESIPNFDQLHQRLLKIFPQCDDLMKRGGGTVTPHFSLAKAGSQKEADALKVELNKLWKPVTFQLREIYMLHRAGSVPFEVYAAIPLGNHNLTPHFGPNSEHDGKDTQVGKTVVMFNIPNTVMTDLVNENIKLTDLFGDKKIVASEIIRNPNGKVRPIITIEFASLSDATDALTTKFPASFEATIIRPLSRLVFPDVCGGSCSIK